MQSPGMAQEALPFLGVSRHDLRHAVVSVLAEKWPLKAKQVYKLVEKERPDITYQGVHKALKQLVEEGAVSETAEGYELSMQWIKGLQDALVFISHNYTNTGKSGLEGTSWKPISISSRPLSILETALRNKVLIWERENIFLYGNRGQLVPTSYMIYTVKGLQQKGLERIMYRAAREMGKEWMTKFIKKVGRCSTEEIMAHGGDMFAFAGWGDYRITGLETNPIKATYVVENSSFAKEYVKLCGKSNIPVDLFLRGSLAGGLSIPFKEPSLEFIETKCLAKGDNYCEFVGMPRRMFDLKDKSIVRQIGSDADMRRMESELARR